MSVIVVILTVVSTSNCMSGYSIYAHLKKEGVRDTERAREEREREIGMWTDGWIDSLPPHLPSDKRAAAPVNPTYEISTSCFRFPRNSK